MGDNDGMSRAQKFEDEKRRIVESCFAKKDTDGSQIESYITHIRVTEDAMYPSNPPPPNSAPDNKKARVIIVAVRKSGRVRVHKARENNNGTFSIGKTWNLDDLGPVQSYTMPNPESRQELQWQQWAGDTGFTVSLGKPYYWQASTYKEKEFFVGSLVKIYRKYTGGKSPELLGFTPQEEQILLGAAKPRPPSAPQQSARSPVPPRTPNAFPPPAPSAGSAKFIQPYPPPSAGSDYSRAPSRNGLSPAPSEDMRPPSRDAMRAPSRDGNRAQSVERNRAQSRERARAPSREGNRAPSRNGYGLPTNIRPPSREGLRAPSREGYREVRKQPSREQMLRPKPSEDQMFAQRMDPGMDTPPRSAQQPPVPQFNRAARQGMNGMTPTPPPQNDDALRQLSGERDTPEPKPEPVKEPTPQPSPERLPERRRAPVQAPDSGQNEPAPKFTTSPPEERENRAPSRGNPKADLTLGAVPPPALFSPARSDDLRNQSSEAATSETASVRSGRSLRQNTADETTPTTEPLTSPDSIVSPTESNDDFRPGLGPMIKKKSAKDIAGTFRKAAMAAGAFKPRAGGAGERLMAQKEAGPKPDEPDGITGVVPAPSLRAIPAEPPKSDTPEQKEIVMSPVSDTTSKSPFSPKKPAASSAPAIHLQRQATEDTIPTAQPEKKKEPKKNGPLEPRPDSPEKTRSTSPTRRRRQMQDARIAKYCNALGIETKVLDGRGGDFDDLLTELGWDGKLDEGRSVDDLQADIRREIGRAQATGWLGHIEQQERKTQELATLFDKVIQECDDLDGLLTLYQHELSTLADDVAYIEAQGQGLQVQTANQKLLQTELENLLRTISISSEDLRELREASLGTPEGLEAAELSLSVLYKAMLTIDPDIRQNRKRQADAGPTDRSGVGVYADAELGQMRAVKEKKDDYREETQLFLKRLNQYMTMVFKIAEQRTTDYLEQNKSGLVVQGTKLDARIREASRNELWMYNAMMLFVREVNSYEWQTLISTYELTIKNAYQDQFRDNVLVWKKVSRKATGDEQDLLFTTQEKEKDSDALSTAARKLTVKRGKTVRVTGNARQSTGDRQDGKIDAFEAFAGAVDEQSKCIAEEQNFVVEFFHVSSLSTADFADIVSSAPPANRRLPNLSARQNYDPDRDMAKMVEKVMDNLFSFWSQDLQNLIEWVLKTDQLQGVGLLYVIEKKLSDYEETNQEYITRTLQRLHDRLIGLFNRFVDEQIRGIEDTKVKIKKRKGVISFMRVFPGFSSVIEGMIPSPTSNTGHHESLEIRFVINDAYTKINKAMFESLNFIAKENPAAAASGPGANSAVSGDPEDKEALNYHILMIENMNHYLEEVETRSNIVLEEWHEKASHEFYDHMKQYIDSVIRRPLGKLLDFVESTEALMKSSTSDSYTSIASKPSHSRSTAKKVVASYDSKEIRKGVETLKKRVEKHFGDADDPGVGRSLVVKVLSECNARYADAHDRMKSIVEKVYESQQGGLDLEWRKEEVAAMFRR